jgi:hypothetical protein
MMRLAKTVLFVILFPLSLSFTSGQSKNIFTGELAEKFRKYCEVQPWEEVYIHTDRDEFIAGEVMWFKAYLIDRLSSKPSSSGSIVYLELVNSENTSVARRRIRTETGSGPGMLILPDTLSTGKYMIRAFTSRMKNFLPGNCFMKEIIIYNALSSRKLQVKSNTEEYSDASVPHDLGKGIIMNINNFKNDTLEIMISANEDYRRRNGNLCYLFIQTHGVININDPEMLSGGDPVIHILKSKLTPGINQVTIFDSFGEPAAVRYIYTPSIQDQSITIESSDSFTVRDKIIIGISSDRKSIPFPDSINLSISVAPVRNRSIVSDIADYMIFGSEYGLLPKFIRNSKLDQIPPETLNKYLMNIKSDWIDWDKILSGKLPVMKYNIENEYHYLSGKLLQRENGEPEPGRYVFLSVPGKVAVFQYAETDKEGNFTFRIPVDQDGMDIILQPEDVSRNDAINIESSFSDRYYPVAESPGNIDQELPPFISEWSVNYQVMKIYGLSSIGDTVKNNVPVIMPQRFYGKPDIELKMDDYIKLPLMEEVFFELIPGVFLKNRRSKYEIEMTDPVDNTIYNKPPVLFIDGVVVNDPSVIAGLDPELVEKIDVVRDKYIVGDYIFYGLINVITRTGDYSCVALPDYSIRVRYNVSDPVCSFSSPDYSSEAKKLSHIPDFRTTLYWNPSVKAGIDGKAKIEFWTSDVTSDYEINAEGITPDGKTVSIRKIIKVR